MKRSLLLLSVGIIVTLLYDTVSAVIARSTGFDYGWFACGSIALYFMFGFMVARHSGWINGMAAGAFIGLFESTVGWAISWMIGPGKPSMDVNVLTVGVTVAFVTISAAIVGLLGGLLSLLMKRNA